MKYTLIILFLSLLLSFQQIVAKEFKGEVISFGGASAFGKLNLTCKDKAIVNCSCGGSATVANGITPTISFNSKTGNAGDTCCTCDFAMTFTRDNDGKILKQETQTITKCCDDLLIILNSFVAIAHIEEGICSVRIEWETASEIDTVGFNIWRAQVENGEYVNITKVNDQLVGIKAESDYQGTSYSYEDHDVIPGNTYYYVLEDIDFAGLSTVHYDFLDSATVQSPLAISP